MGVDRSSETITMTKKASCQSKAVSSPRKIEIKIPVSSTAASTVSASTGASSTSEISIVKVDDDGALTTPPCSLSGHYGTTNR